MSQVTEILGQMAAGDSTAAEQLLPLVYDELRRLAALRLAQEKPGQTLQATALVHEADLRLVDVRQLQSWDSRSHFFCAAAEAMRRILIEQARRKGRQKRGGTRQRHDLQEVPIQTSASPDEVLAISDALNIHLGNGNGTFRAPLLHSMPIPLSIAVADFNRDGRPDIAAPTASESSVRILIGNGNGTFQDDHHISFADAPRTLHASDLNGDGHSDLVIRHRDHTGNRPFGIVSVLYNDANWNTGFNAQTGGGDSGDDPKLKHQYGLQITDTVGAWQFTTGTAATVAAVIDTGIDYTHPDLYLNIWVNQSEIPSHVAASLTDVDGDGVITFWDLNNPINQGPGKINDLNGTGYIDAGDLLVSIDDGGWVDGLDDGNGYVDDLVGWDFAHHDNDPFDVDGHGTWAAGVIGAVGNNGVGIAGVNWKIQLMAVKRLPDTGTGTVQATIVSIYYAIDNGARVSNNSYAVPIASLTEDEIAAGLAAIRHGQSKGHLFVAAAGNRQTDLDVSPLLPAAYDLDNIIAVAATDDRDRLWTGIDSAIMTARLSY